MDEFEIKRLKDIEQFLDGAVKSHPVLECGKDEVYAWIERTLRRFDYLRVSKKAKGVVRRYIAQLSGYSRQQVTRLIAQYRQTNRLHRRHRTVNGFKSKYTPADIKLLAGVDKLVDDVSGTTTKAYCHRMYDLFNDAEYIRLKDISVSHIYNLRGGKVYQRIRKKFTKTEGVKISIGKRCKPSTNGEPGYLRIDSAHQGDMDGKKSVYHINAVDQETQWEVVITIEQIKGKFMIPALKSVLEQIPFVVKGVHADNGSEYINHLVAKLLNELAIELTKSRARHSNDNALAESKNNSVVRKTFGYVYIPKKFASLMNKFNEKDLNPCLNFHRPCHFPTVEIDSKGKERKRYRQEDMMTPYEKFKSMPNAEQYLKDGITFEMLEAEAMKESDMKAWEKMQKARSRMFDIIFAEPTEAA